MAPDDDPSGGEWQRFSRRGVLALSGLALAASHAAPARANTAEATIGEARAPNPGERRPLSATANLPEADRQQWKAFKRRFIAADGRVIDTGNGGISHSEGQGWGMLFAVAFDDGEAFGRIHRWTEATLRRPSDSLHAWCYRPGKGNPVADSNNATDGDIYIAAALARAGARWSEAKHLQAAAAIADDLLRLLVRRTANRTLLLPGLTGFEWPDRLVVNPSYYAFGLLPELAAVAPSPQWDLLRQDGLALIGEGRFGRWMLPPDWLQVARRTGALAPAAPWPARFSFDAIRIPLNLAWARLTPPGVAQSFQSYWEAAAYPFHPAWVDLGTGVTSPYPASAGIRAVAEFFLASDRGRPTEFPVIDPSMDYYSAALIMLSRIASVEIGMG